MKAGLVGVPHASRSAGHVIVLLTVVNLFNYMDRMALAVLAPSIKRDLALTDGQLGQAALRCSRRWQSLGAAERIECSWSSLY